MKTNGLELKHIGTASEPMKEFAAGDLRNVLADRFDGNGFVVAYLDNRVLIGRWNGEKFSFHDDSTLNDAYVQKIRVFDRNREFLAWRTHQGFKGRIRKDDFQGEGADVVIAEQALAGTRMEKAGDGFSKIFETSGARLYLPFEPISVDSKKNRIFIKTHNYVEYNHMNQATYEDCRFVEFTAGGEPLE